MKASLELQRLVAAALAGDAHLLARNIAVFDGPPANARPPYLSIGGDTVVSRGWQEGQGSEHRFTISLWDNRDSLAEAKAILADEERAVLAIPAVRPGLRLIGLRLARGSVRRTTKNWMLGQLEFRTLTVMED